MGHGENHGFELHNLVFSRMTKIYLFQSFMSFAKAMVGLFLPVYLYSLGFSLIQIYIYAIGVSATFLILNPFVISLINKIGFKYIFLLTVPIYLFHLLTINYILESMIFFHLAWFSIGAYVAFFWPAFHSEMAVNGTVKHRASEVGTLQIIITILRSLAPLIAGFVLQAYGYWNLLLIAMTVVVIGTIPLLLSSDIKLKNYNFGFKDYVRLFKMKNMKSSKLAFASEGIHAHLLGFFTWPIIVFILLNQNFVSWGILLTLVSLLGVFFILYFRKYLDKKNKNEVLRISGKLLSLNWFLKSLVLFFGSIFLYFVESTARLINSVFELSILSIFYNNAKKMIYMDYILLRELFVHGTKIVSCLVAIGILFIFGESIQTLIYIVILGIVAPALVVNLKEF